MRTPHRPQHSAARLGAPRPRPGMPLVVLLHAPLQGLGRADRQRTPGTPVAPAPAGLLHALPPLRLSLQLQRPWSAPRADFLVIARLPPR